MKRKDFIQSFEPVRVNIAGKPKVVGYIKDGVFRSVVKYSKHVLHKREGRPPAIAKEAWIYRNIIRQRCQLWEVFDEERNIILLTTTANFDTHCEEWHWNNLVQLLLEDGRDGWFTILTPGRVPHQAIVHWDGEQADFFDTLPEQLIIE